MLQGQKVEIPISGNFDPIPVDKYTVQCVDVDLIRQLKYLSSEEEDVLNYKFAILDEKEMEVTDPKTGEKKMGSTRGRFVWKKCRLALGERAWLRKFANAAAGRTLTKEELAKFDPESLVGQQVDIMVESKDSSDGEKTYTNIISFNKTIKKLKGLDKSEVKETGKVVEKKTSAVPTTAPSTDDEADDLTKKLKAEEDAEPSTPAKGEVAAETPSEDVSLEEAEAQLKLAKIKAKKAGVAEDEDESVLNWQVKVAKLKSKSAK